MSSFIAALPMYDWPERRGEVDAAWDRLREAFRSRGIDAPERLVRRNADLPPVPGGVRDAGGNVVAPDPATLKPEEFNHHVLWNHPALLFAQTCWGPMGLGLSRHVQVVGQPNYDGFEGGKGELYSSAIVMREADAGVHGDVPAPADGGAQLKPDLLRGKRFAYNSPDSMSGILAIAQDLETAGESLSLFSDRIESGGHRASVVAVAEGKADVAAIDCRSWAMARRFEPAARHLTVTGWTARRKGLPFITARTTPEGIVTLMREVIAASK